MNLNLLIKLLLLAFFICSCKAPNLVIKNSSFLPSGTESKYNSDYILIEYCPDNTCDRFETESVNNMKVLEEFTLIYLYHFSDYYTLDHWKSNKGVENIVKSLLNKYHKSCKDNINSTLAVCALKNLESSYLIKVHQIRFDEKKVNKHVIELNKLLSNN